MDAMEDDRDIQDLMAEGASRGAAAAEEADDRREEEANPARRRAACRQQLHEGRIYGGYSRARV